MLANDMPYRKIGSTNIGGLLNVNILFDLLTDAFTIDCKYGSLLRSVTGHFSIPYSYEFHCTSIGEALETLGNKSLYCFYVWGSQAIKLIGNETNASSSKNASEQDRTKVECQSRDDVEIVEVLMTDSVDTMSF